MSAEEDFCHSGANFTNVPMGTAVVQKYNVPTVTILTMPSFTAPADKPAQWSSTDLPYTTKMLKGVGYTAAEVTAENKLCAFF